MPFPAAAYKARWAKCKRCGGVSVEHRAYCSTCLNTPDLRPKLCPRCKETKPSDAYYIKHNRLDSWCILCRRESHRKWMKANPEYMKSYLVDYGLREETRKKRTAWHGDARDRAREVIRQRYGKDCVCCGESDPIKLTLDHIDGLGAKDRSGTKERGVMWYMVLIRKGLPDGYQTMCFSCNYAKHALGRCGCSDDSRDALSLVGACG